MIAADGSGALPLLLPESMIEPYQQFTRQPMLGIIGILIAWRLFDAIWDPVFLFAVNGLYPGSGYH